MMKIVLALTTLSTHISVVMGHTPTVPHAVLAKFKRKDALKDSWVPTLKTVPRGVDSFDIGGTRVAFDDLEPINDLFAADAVVKVNGVPQAPKVFVYTSKTHPEVRVVLDDRKHLIKASMRRPNGNEIDLLPIQGHTFAEVDIANDVDLAKLESFEMV